MSAIDKVRNKADEFLGDIKKNVGRGAGDKGKTNESRVQETKGDVTSADENVKDALRDGISRFVSIDRRSCDDRPW